MNKEWSQRFEVIELFVYWQGRVNTTHLTRHFQISRQSASSTLQRYNTQYPNNLIYCEFNKGYIAQSAFNLYHASQAFSRYQQLLNQDANCLAIEQIEIPTRNPPQQLTQPILRAIDNHQAIDIGYTSLQTPEYRDRIIEPHSLIFDGLRWHVRAFCRKNQTFRDFVLSRFNGEAVCEGAAQVDPANDTLWHSYIEIEIEPDPRLTAAQQQVIVDDYQMIDNKLKITTRAALISYLLKRMHLDHYQQDPCAQQIVLTQGCLTRIKPYRFDL